MGLAVSLVSTVKERVWFCRKGKKPPCEDTRDFNEGGKRNVDIFSDAVPAARERLLTTLFCPLQETVSGMTNPSIL